MEPSTESNSGKNGLNDTFKINRTGLIYDPVMLDYKCEWDEKYPEKPDRIKKPYERCQFYGLTEKCIRLPGRLSTDEEVEKCHTARVNNMMKKCETMTTDELKEISLQYDSMYFSNGSSEAARFALGSSIDLLDSIMTNKVDNGFAIIRPPGHHAMCDAPNGYCYFNNAAVVAKTAIEKYGMNRVLIVDWDVHHGQGVQYAFYDDPKVLYFSMHRYDYGEFWPNLRQGDFDYIGEKDGKGFNINVPLNKTGLGNSEYSAAFYNLLLPIAYEYKPELVILSCGYDAAIGCFEGRMRVTPAGYAHFINALSCLTNGKLCVLLEGGYCIKSLSEGVALSVRALLGYPTPRVEDYLKPDPNFVETLKNVTAVLRPYWKCLQNLNDPDSMSLNEYLLDWDKKHRDKIAFYNNENPPDEFELTGFYPLYSDEENIRLDKEIDDLIKNTNLSVPEYKTCIPSDRKLIKELNNTNVHMIPKHESDSPLKSVINSICKQESSNGLCEVKDYSQLFEEAKTCKNTFNRILIVNLLNEIKSDQMTNDEKVLQIDIGLHEIKACSHNNKLKIGFDAETSLLTGFLRIIMPIAYQFNPDMTFIYLDNDVSTAKTLLTSNYFTHILKLLTGLSNGKTILTFERGDYQSSDFVNKSINILLGGQCDSLPKLIPDEKAQMNLKEKNEKLKSEWDCFQFNEKLPH